MAVSTSTMGFIRASSRGHVKIRDYLIDVTAAKADGVAITPASVGFSKIFEAIILSQEIGGFVHQYVVTSAVTTNAAKHSACGAGALRAYEAGADAAALDECVGDEDLGEFRVRFEGI